MQNCVTTKRAHLMPIHVWQRHIQQHQLHRRVSAHVQAQALVASACW